MGLTVSKPKFLQIRTTFPIIHVAAFLSLAVMKETDILEVIYHLADTHVKHPFFLFSLHVKHLSFLYM